MTSASGMRDFFAAPEKLLLAELLPVAGLNAVADGLAASYVLGLYPNDHDVIGLQSKLLALVRDSKRSVDEIHLLLDAVVTAMDNHDLSWLDLVVCTTNARIPEIHESGSVIAAVGSETIFTRAAGRLADEAYFFLNMLVKLTAYHLVEVSDKPVLEYGPDVPAKAAACFSDLVEVLRQRG